MGRSRRCSRGAVAPLAAAWLVGGLLACGGGGASTTTVTTHAASGAATATATTAPTAGATTAPAAKTAAAPAAPAPAATTPAATAPKHLSPAAQGFLVKRGDNSIPEYGQEAGASERAHAEAALATFLSARAHGDWARVCTVLAAPSRAQLERLGKAVHAKGRTSSCDEVLAALSRGPAAARADTLVGPVAALRVKGKVAFALYHGPHGTKYAVPMRNEGGAWKVGQLAPLPYPLGTTATP